MRWFKRQTLIASAGALILPFATLVYIASIPGKKPAALVVLQGAIVIVGILMFALFLKRLVEQMNTVRVGRWLSTPEGKEWLEGLPEDERERFQGNLDRLT